MLSTHGEGEPPLQAKTFNNFLHSTSAPGMDEVLFSVLAHGDYNYKHFCKTGTEIKNRFT